MLEGSFSFNVYFIVLDQSLFSSILFRVWPISVTDNPSFSPHGETCYIWSLLTKKKKEKQKEHENSIVLGFRNKNNASTHCYFLSFWMEEYCDVF